MEIIKDLRILILVACILVAASLWRAWRRRPWKALRSGIPMDGAQCLVAENGDVSIGPYKTYRFIFLASAATELLWAVSLVLGIAASAGVSSSQIPWSWIQGSSILGAILLAGAGLLVFRSLGSTKIQALPGTREIISRRGFRIRQYPFGRVSHIGVLIHNKMSLSVHRTYMLRTAEQIAEIELVLADGGWISLGKCSGAEAENQALSVSRHVADAIGVPVRKTKNV